MSITVEKTRLGIYFVLVLFILSASAVVFSKSEDSKKGGTPYHIPVPREAMITGLGSANPNPSMGEEAQTFDRLVGTWDAEFSFHRDDGTVYHKKGENPFRLGHGWDGHPRSLDWLSARRPEGPQYRNHLQVLRYETEAMADCVYKSSIQLPGYCAGRTRG